MKNVGKRFLFISIFVILLDQITKNVIYSMTSSGSTYKVVPYLFNIIHVYNTGAGFGILKNQNNLLIGVSILVVLLVGYHFKDIPNTLVASFVALIFSGAIGNLIDRLRFGFVIDFLDVGVGYLRWPTFSVADMAIVIGAIGLGYYWWKE